VLHEKEGLSGSFSRPRRRSVLDAFKAGTRYEERGVYPLIKKRKKNE